MATMYSTTRPLVLLKLTERRGEARSVRAARHSERGARVRSALYARALDCSRGIQFPHKNRRCDARRCRLSDPAARGGAVAAISWDWRVVSEAAQTASAPGMEQ